MTIKMDKKERNSTLFVLGGILLFIVFILNVGLGSVKINVDEIFQILVSDSDVNKSHASIIMNIRLPRTMATLLGGACLATSGLLLQIFFGNPIVEPFILGISSGSNLFVGLVMLGGVTFGMGTINSMGMFIGSFIGAMLVMIAVIFASQKVKNITTLLVVGLMFGYICSSITSVLTALANHEKISKFTMWTMGSFSGFRWADIKLLYIMGLPFLLLAFFMSKPLNSMLLGEKYAQSMGISINKFRFLMVLVSSVLTAVVTAFAGPVSFIGLAVPHIVRISFKTSNNRVIIPAVCIYGAIMAGLCDLISRIILAPTEIPIGAITSIIGAPMVVFLLVRKKGSEF
jgi:iron complex transport system permease protein